MNNEGTAVSETAFRLAWQDGNAFQMSEYAFLAPEAAEKAAPSLNRVRAARGREMYSHVIVFAGEQVKQIVPLESAA